MKILGIDPGLSGAVVRLTWPDMTLEARRDFKTLSDIAVAVEELGPGCHAAVVEFVAARPGQGVTSMFSFGRSTGVAMGALYTIRLPFIEASPTQWQNRVRELIQWEGEFDARAMASMVFVGDMDLFDRVKDHGTADAALIAWYGADRLGHGQPLKTWRKKGLRQIGPVTVGAPATPPAQSD